MACSVTFIFKKAGGARCSAPGLQLRRVAFRLLLSTAYCLLPTAYCLAHGGKPHQLSDLPYTWGRDPVVWACLLASGWLYARGVRRLWRESGRGRGVRRWEAAAYADRKSTRLNSSHANISYAVFCLKKKKQPTAIVYLNRHRTTP